MINSNETPIDLWRRLDGRRGQPDDGLLETLVKMLEDQPNAQAAADLLIALADEPLFQRGLAEHLSPNVLVRFVGQLATKLKPSSILDPTCGCGLMLRSAISGAKPRVAFGVELEQRSCRIARMLLANQAEVIEGDAFVHGEELTGPFELVVADPPMKLRRVEMGSDCEGSGREEELAETLVHWSLARLASDGTLAVLTSPRLARDERFRSRVLAAGARFRAIIHVPAGTRLATGIASYLLLIDRKPQSTVFIAQLDRRVESHEQLLDNLLHEREGPHPALGALRLLEAFTGFEQLEASYRLDSRLRGSRLIQIEAAQALIAVERADGTGRQPRPLSDLGDNELYLRMNGRPLDVSEESSSSPRNVLLLRLNSDFVDREFFLRWLNADLGRHVLQSISVGSAVPMITVRALREAKFPLPPITEQKQIAESLRHVDRLRKQLDDLEESCWDGRQQGKDILLRVATLNNPERLEDWVESLPFPLATVLWRHHSTGGDARLRIKPLADFFEALAEFLATVHLSAFRSEPAAWAERQSELARSLSAAHLRIEHATFGTWKCIVENLSKKARSMLNSGEEELVREMYALQDDRVLRTLLAPELISILSDAVSIRNTHLGHVGAMGKPEAEGVEAKFLALVERLRSVFGTSWSRYELVLAEASSYRDGVFRHHMPRVMGTRTPFARVQRQTRDPLEDGRLYLLGEGSVRGLPLLPFIRMMPSPSKALHACYFFNRVQAGGLRFVSYHFEDLSEICQDFSDTAAAIVDLTRPTDQAALGGGT